MAKKLGKFLLGAAALGGAAAAVLYYLQNREQTANEEMDDFEDLDDFDAAFDKAEEEDEDDMDAADMGERSYVPLDYGKDAPQADATVPKAPGSGVSKSVPDVEEFFDDEDSSMDAM